MESALMALRQHPMRCMDRVSTHDKLQNHVYEDVKFKCNL